MKNWSSILCLACGVAASALHAQDQSPLHTGEWIIGGAAGVSHSHDNSTDQTTTSFYVSPDGLVFVAPGLAVGTALVWSHVKSSTSVISQSDATYGIGPAVRYYIAKHSSTILPFIAGSVTWQSTRISSGTTVLANGTTIETADGNSQGSTVLDGSIGLTWLVATHVGITGEVYDTHAAFSGQSAALNFDHTSNAVGLRFGVTTFIK